MASERRIDGRVEEGKALPGAVEIITGRLYWISVRGHPRDTSETHFFSVDSMFVYWNFFLDFGPLNLSQTYRFCQLVSSKLRDEALAGKRLYLYCGQHSHRRANSSLLMGIYSMLYLGRTPEAAYEPFRDIYPPFPPFHDASPCVCTYHLTVLDCLRGVYKAHNCGFFSFDEYDVEEAEHFERVEYGDLNWVAEGRFLAFAGPHETRTATYDGLYTLTPEDYLPHFTKKGVAMVVRLNKKYYDERRFKRAGLQHVDLYYLDGSTPPERVLRSFMESCESTEGAIAVHCKAGLGRTGSCIGAYLMKHYAFSAAEVIGWLRVCRPGSVIGPQQQYLEHIQERMWREGRAFRAARGYAPAGVKKLKFPTVNVPPLAKGPIAGLTTTTSSSSGAATGARSSTLEDGTSKRSVDSISPPDLKEASIEGPDFLAAMPRAPATPGGRSVTSDTSQGDFLRSAKSRSPIGSPLSRRAPPTSTVARSLARK